MRDEFNYEWAQDSTNCLIEDFSDYVDMSREFYVPEGEFHENTLKPVEIEKSRSVMSKAKKMIALASGLYTLTFGVFGSPLGLYEPDSELLSEMQHGSIDSYYYDPYEVSHYHSDVYIDNDNPTGVQDVLGWNPDPLINRELEGIYFLNVYADSSINMETFESDMTWNHIFTPGDTVELEEPDSVDGYDFYGYVLYVSVGDYGVGHVYPLEDLSFGNTEAMHVNVNDTRSYEIHAAWRANASQVGLNFPITFHGNGGVIDDNGEDEAVINCCGPLASGGTIYPGAVVKASRPGYRFIGWTNGEGAFVSVVDPVTLIDYPNWDKPNYYLHLYAAWEIEQ